MAKSAKIRFVKLGETASSFSCPSTGISVGVGAVVELTPTIKASKKVIAALKGGHLEYAEESEIPEDGGESEGGKITEEFLNSKTKAVLVPMALALLTDEDEEDAEDIEAMKKAELVEFIILKNN